MSLKAINPHQTDLFKKEAFLFFCFIIGSGGIAIAEMLFCTSLIALVGAGEHPSFSPRKLQIVNTKRQSTICELTFSTAVLGVKLNRKRLVVVLEEHIYIYDISNMKLLHTIDTSPNPNALCSLSPSSDNCYLVYPSNASSALGEVLIFDAIKLQAVNIVQAHKSPLSCLSFNFEGTKGTVIRVFSIPDGSLLYQYRRGTYTARILSISFNLSSTLLCVSSDTDTVHIYKLETPHGNQEYRGFPISGPFAASTGTTQLPSANTTANLITGYLDQLTSPIVSAAGAVGSYLPSNITDIWEPQRHFAFAKIPAQMSVLGGNGSSSNSKDRINICSFSPGDRPLVAVLTSEGSFYLYSIPDEGGECSLIKTDSVMNDNEDDME